MFVDFIVYYFILDVTISHIITVKSLIVVIRKPSFFGGGLDRCDIIMRGATWCDTLWQEGREGIKVLRKA